MLHISSLSRLMGLTRTSPSSRKISFPLSHKTTRRASSHVARQPKWLHGSCLPRQRCGYYFPHFCVAQDSETCPTMPASDVHTDKVYGRVLTLGPVHAGPLLLLPNGCGSPLPCRIVTRIRYSQNPFRVDDESTRIGINDVLSISHTPPSLILLTCLLNSQSLVSPRTNCNLPVIPEEYTV